MLFSNLFYLPLLIPLVASFAVEAPSQATVGRSTQFKWIRHNGDPSSFSLLLRRNDQDRGGVIVETIRSTSQSQGTSQFTADRATNYLIEVISDLTALADNQQPQRIMATSSTITAVQDSNPPPPPPQNTSPTSTNNPQQQPTQRPQDTTTSQTSSTTTIARNGDSNNNAGGGQQTNTGTTAQTTPAGGNGNSSPGQGQGTGTDTAGSGAATGTTGGGSGGSNTSLPPSNFSTNSGLPPPGDSAIPITSTSTSGGASGPTSTNSSSPDPPLAGATSKKNNLGVILGAVFGTLLFILLICCLLFAWNRRRRRQNTREFAFRRDLMVQRSAPDMEEQGSRQSRVSFRTVERSYNSADFTGESSTRETTMSTPDSFTEGLEAYQSYWNSNPNGGPGGGPDSVKSWSLHVPAASASNFSTLSDSTNASSSPSVFYTAVPQPAAQAGAAKPPQPPQPLYQTTTNVASPRQSLYQTLQPLYQTSAPQQPLYQTQRLAPGFTFPARPASIAFATLIPPSPPSLTDRQAAIQNKVVQLRAQMIRLQSENARGSGTTDRSTYSDDSGKVQNREEIQKIREEIGRLEEIMNSSWARRNESASELPAGLRT